MGKQRVSKQMDSIYTPLDRSRNEIRLLRLLAAQSHTSNIAYELIHVSLDAEPSYEALSYTWDSGHLTEYVEAGGKGFWITKNLHAALRALRLPNGDRDLWVDAVCINQKDIPERNQEVLRMLSIYQNAKKVVVWLGEASADSEVAMNHLALLDRQWHEAKLLRPKQSPLFAKSCSLFVTVMRIVLGLLKSILYSARKQPVVAAAFLAALLCWWIYPIPYVLSAASFSFLPKFVRGIAEYLMRPRVAIKQERQALPDANVIRALKALFSRRWFRRTWVIQEIAASRDAIVVCGSHELSWDAMRTATTRIVELVDSDPEKSPYLESDFQKMDFLSSVLDTQSIPGYGVRMKRSLLYMINCFSLFDATDARDKVYGLLGLSEEARLAHPQGQILKPDYGQPVEWVYADVVRYLVSTTNQLDVLRACLGSGKVSGLPSWAPDWTVTMLRSVSGFSYHRDPFRLPDDKDQQHPVARFSEDLKVMVVRGFTIGRLIGASEIWLDPSLSQTFHYKAQKTTSEFMLYILRVVYFLLDSLLRIWGVGALLRSLSRRNPAGLGFLFTVLNDLRTKFLHGQQVTVSRTSEALAKHADSTGREKLVRKSFRCEQAPCLQWMAKTCDTYADAQAGDFICMLIGAKVPFLIRYEGTEGRLVGPANLAGFMAQSLLWKDVVKHYKMGDLQLVGYSLH